MRHCCTKREAAGVRRAGAGTAPQSALGRRFRRSRNALRALFAIYPPAEKYFRY